MDSSSQTVSTPESLVRNTLPRRTGGRGFPGRIVDQLRPVAVPVGIGLAYYLAVRLGQTLSLPSGYNVAVWPANSILLAALLVVPVRRWWAVAAAVVVAGLLADIPYGLVLATAIAYIAADVAEAALAAYLIRRAGIGLPRFDALRDTLVFLGAAVVVAPAVVGGAVALLEPLLGSGIEPLVLFRRWYLGDAVTHLTVTPFAVVLVAMVARRERPTFAGTRSWEVGALIVALAAASAVAFVGPKFAWPALVAFPVPVLLWAAFRLGARGTTAVIAGIGLLAITLASRGLLHFAPLSLEENIINLQLFLLLIVAPLLVVSALVQEHRSAAASLRDSVGRYRGVVESQTEFIVRWRPDGTRTFVNDAYCRYFGVRRDDLLGSSVLPQASPTDRDEARDRAARLSPDSPVESSVDRVVRADGSTAWHEWVDRGMFDAGGALVEIQSVGRDVTDRVAAEAALRDSERRYRGLFERNLAGVYRSTVDGRILDCNDAFARIFGCESREQMLRLSAQTFYDSSEDRESLLDDLRRSGELRSVARRFRRLEGDEIWTLSNLALTTDENGEATVIEGTMIDMTDQRRMEEQLRHAQKMEAVGRLAGGIAHDFNNILQAMLGLTHKLRAGVTGEATERLAELDGHVLRGSRLTRQLLLFSRRDTGSVETVQLDAVIDESLSLLRRLLPENIAVHRVRSAAELWLAADRGQIEQVVMNLAVNAADAMPGGGTLTIRTGREDDRVWLEVEDDGCGIPPDLRQRIFEPFFTTKDATRGTGLGLSVVQGIVLRYGGTIEVRGAADRGSCFRVTLPAGRRSISGELRAASTQLGDGCDERILLVEDDEAVRESVMEVLVDLGYRVTAMPNVAAVTALPTDECFDLLLTDYLLPDGKGTEVAAILVDRQPDLPCIVMSGYAAGMTSDASDPVGYRFLQKPLTVDALAKAIRSALGQPTRAAADS